MTEFGGTLGREGSVRLWFWGMLVVEMVGRITAEASAPR